MQFEHIGGDPPDDTSGDTPEPREEREFGIVRKLERDPQLRAVIALTYELGGQSEDVTELLRLLSGRYVDLKQVRQRVRVRPSSREYARYLLDSEVTEAHKHIARSYVLPYLETHRASTLWRHEPVGAAVAYHALSANVSRVTRRVFARTIAKLYDNPDAFYALQGTYSRALKEVGRDKLLEELRNRAGEQITAAQLLAEALINESEDERDSRLIRRAEWQRNPVARKRVADLLEKNASAPELRNAIREIDASLELKASSVHTLIERYRRNPTRVLANLRKEKISLSEGTGETEIEGMELTQDEQDFVGADFWKRDVRAAQIITRMIGLGALSSSIKKALDVHYPTNGIPPEIIERALASTQGRANCLNALDKETHWVLSKEKGFVERRAFELLKQSLRG